MKNISVAVTLLLFAAVLFLYVKVFSSPKQTTSSAINTKSSSPLNQKSVHIAFVELDSLNDNIGYIKDRRSQLETEQKAIETEWQSGYRTLENRKNDFLKRGNSITQQEAEKFQGELMQQQQQVDGKKQALTQKLSEKSYQFMDDIQSKLKLFLKDYNKDGKYQYILTTGTGLDYMLYKDSSLNITADVIKGMNEKMNSNK